MERKRWADESDSSFSESEEPEASPQPSIDFASFKFKYSKLRPPISLFIKNISFSCNSDQEISSWFTSQLNAEVSIHRNFKKAFFKGNAKVVVNSLELAHSLVNLSGKEYLGRPLEIKVLDSCPTHLKHKNRSTNSFCHPPRNLDVSTVGRLKITQKKNMIGLPPRPYQGNHYVKIKQHDVWKREGCEGVLEKSGQEKTKEFTENDPSIVSVMIKPEEKALLKPRRTRSYYRLGKKN